MNGFYFLNPIINVLCSCHQLTAASRIELYRQRRTERRAPAGLFHIFQRMAGPAAVGLEKDDLLAAEIMIRQKRLDRRRHRIPPSRRTYGNDVIIRRIIRQGLNFRHEAAVHFPLALSHNIVISAFIGMKRFNSFHVSAGSPLQLSRNLRGIPIAPTILNLSRL